MNQPTNAAPITSPEISSDAPLASETPDENSLASYLTQLENRIAFLESEQRRFTNALISAGEFLFKNPASKMMLAAFPKDMQKKLQEFFDGAKNGEPPNR